MNSHAKQMPARFPVGTKLVIESHKTRDGQSVYARHLEFPDGTFFPLPSRAPQARTSKARSPRGRRH
ncbi:MAG TPA: hypothetical protein VHD59_09040 [Pseudolabrys sp.]|jgi:hypothetical protein|nr:hypothetical protein [Pseudolabrys sp.]